MVRLLNTTIGAAGAEVNGKNRSPEKKAPRRPNSVPEKAAPGGLNSAPEKTPKGGVPARLNSARESTPQKSRIGTPEIGRKAASYLDYVVQEHLDISEAPKKPEKEPPKSAQKRGPAVAELRSRIEVCGKGVKCWTHCGCCARVFVPLFCDQRLCWRCAERKARELFRRHAGRLADFRFPAHVVLTVPNRPAGSLAAALDDLSAALCRLTRTKFWRSRVRAAVVGLGLTWTRGRRGERGTPPGWHPHWHLLVDSEYLPQGALQREWERACRLPLAIPYVRRANDVRGLFAEILLGSRDDAKRLVGQSDVVLAEAAAALRGRRRVRFYGSLPEVDLDLPPDDGRAHCPLDGVTFRWREWEWEVFRASELSWSPADAHVSFAGFDYHSDAVPRFEAARLRGGAMPTNVFHQPELFPVPDADAESAWRKAK